MQKFFDIARLDQIAPGTAIALVTATGSVVALFNVAGHIFTLDDSCIRCGSSLAAGSLRGAEIGCSGCDWQYDVTTGCVNGIPALRIDTFETKIVDARIIVAMPGTSHPDSHST